MYKITVIWDKDGTPSEFEPEDYIIDDEFIRLDFKDNNVFIPFTSIRYWRETRLTNKK
jgi:hypothetical protein